MAPQSAQQFADGKKWLVLLIDQYGVAANGSIGISTIFRAGSPPPKLSTLRSHFIRTIVGDSVLHTEVLDVFAPAQIQCTAVRNEYISAPVAHVDRPAPFSQ